MRHLTVLFDANCGLCRSARAFLEAEPKYVELRFVPAGSARALALFPTLDHAATRNELTVVGEDGSVWRDSKAFLICLWALRDYRSWAARLASPEWLPHARRFFHWFSENRTWIAQFSPFGEVEP